MKTILLFLLSIVLFSCSQDSIVDFETENTLYDSHPRATEFQEYLHSKVTAGYPGAIMLVQDSSGLWIGSDGYADIKNKIWMGTDNISCVGSITKTYTATAIMLLAESGAINLDDKIADILPNSVIKDIKNAKQATIRQLLNHTSGIFNYTLSDEFQIAVLNIPDKKMSISQCLDWSRDRKAYNEPGEDFEYSNTGYILLGEIIEEVTGIKTETYFKEQIFEPINLNHTYYSASTLPKDRVKGYIDLYGDGTIIEATDVQVGHYSVDGGLISNALDVAVFLQSLCKGTIVSIDSFQEMTTWGETNMDEEFNRTYYGYGLERWDTAYGSAVGHQGAMWGYFADAYYFPEQDITYVLLANGSQGKIEDVSKDIIKTVPDLLFQ